VVNSHREGVQRVRWDLAVLDHGLVELEKKRSGAATACISGDGGKTSKVVTWILFIEERGHASVGQRP
jgi:hypothetical protein